jgi:hypothetical protein
MATATLQDMSILATDSTFQNRVAMSLYVYCWNGVPSEAITAASLALHNARKNLAAQILNNPSNYTSKFVNAAATNQIVANEATVNGTLVGMTPAQLATAALGCTDSDINNAVAAAFNAFIPGV